VNFLVTPKEKGKRRLRIESSLRREKRLTAKFVGIQQKGRKERGSDTSRTWKRVDDKGGGSAVLLKKRERRSDGTVAQLGTKKEP